MLLDSGAGVEASPGGPGQHPGGGESLVVPQGQAARPASGPATWADTGAVAQGAQAGFKARCHTLVLSGPHRFCSRACGAPKAGSSRAVP